MKRSLKSQVGVTLLEIMLVLAIAAMVIVMSIRYYQAASLNQKLNAMANTLTGVIAAGESYLAAYGTYSAMDSTALAAYLPGGQMPYSAFGGQITIENPTDTGYSLRWPMIPAQSCTQMQALIPNTPKLTLNCDGAQISS